MNNSILLGAMGWRHAQWVNHFYPEELPQDWQLSYYSNEFECVLVPRVYWDPSKGYDIETWLEGVNETFRFIIELPDALTGNTAAFELFEAQIKQLDAQLVAIIIDDALLSEAQAEKLSRYATLLNRQVSRIEDAIVYRDTTGQAALYRLEDGLQNLRETRKLLDLITETDEQILAVIVESAGLKAHDLLKLRQVMDIMGI